MNSIDCICQAAAPEGTYEAVEAFEEVREHCPALKEILVPDSIWFDFKKAVRGEMDEAQHQSILILAFIRGYLRNITSPLHRFLLEDGKPKDVLTKQYKKDLREQWLFENNVLERHHKTRIFLGKLTEILCALWLEHQGWRIANLQALGGNVDIEAVSPDSSSFSIEVKYVGRLDEEFMAAVESLSVKGGVFKVSPYASSNFFLFKVYTAAKQLDSLPPKRMVLLVISYMTWDLVEMVISENWMRWHEPRFFNADAEWNMFFEKMRKFYPQINIDLQSTINSLNQLWIVRNEYGFSYSLQDTIHFDAR